MVFTKDVGVAVKEFSAQCSQHIRPVEIPFILCNLGVENCLQKHVAALLKHHISIPLVKAFKKFISLFNKVDADGLMCLDFVPLATVLCTKAFHNLFKVTKVKAFALFQFLFGGEQNLIKCPKILSLASALFSVK